MLDRIRFDDLESVLRELGFARQRVKGRHVLLKHADTGTLVILPPMRPTTWVDAPHLAVVRKTVVENGLAEADAFEEMLGKASDDNRRVVPSRK